MKSAINMLLALLLVTALPAQVAAGPKVELWPLSAHQLLYGRGSG
ncbi:hypothetical protein [Geoalkalibacter ferrihydriticus]|nr:hypothetical protein [Geoalkalibacter ferrihydriticus]